LYLVIILIFINVICVHKWKISTAEVVATPQGSKQSSKGKIALIDNPIDPATGSVMARAIFENVDDLFCVNERLITYVRGGAGEVATIMVGATSVGHITAAYDDSLETNRGGAGSARDYAPSIPVSRGDELGTFHLGSTAIVLFAQGDLEFEALTPGMPIRMGQAIVRRRSQK
jgi:multidrug efflux pump subunit AcrA (membrane-fusion protein)